MSAEDAVRDVIDRLASAWNRADGAGFAELFAEDADYVTGAGVRLSGRGRIQAVLSSAAAGGPRMGDVVMTTESVKHLAQNVALVHCRWQMGEGAKPQAQGPNDRAGLLTVVLRETGGEWCIIALHNTDRVD